MSLTPRRLIRSDRFLRRRVPIHKRGPRIAYPKERRRYVVDGHYLTEGESAIYEALVKLKIPFYTSETMLLGFAGGLQLDFVLPPPYRIVIEYQGEVHELSENRGRDMFRALLRGLAGYRIVYIYEEDLDHIYEILASLVRDGITSTKYVYGGQSV